WKIDISSETQFTEKSLSAIGLSDAPAEDQTDERDEKNLEPIENNGTDADSETVVDFVETADPSDDRILPAEDLKEDD
ncbi:MAG: hypothetical protein MUP57_00315, partial [Clostridia bacterium]|nr:hypothetical protein [Clostridia bacterium]